MKTVAMIPDEALEEQRKELDNPKFFSLPVKTEWLNKIELKTTSFFWCSYWFGAFGALTSVPVMTSLMGLPGIEFAPLIAGIPASAFFLFSGFSIWKYKKYSKQKIALRQVNSNKVKEWLNNNYEVAFHENTTESIERRIREKPISPDWVIKFSDLENNTYAIKVTKDELFYIEESDNGWETAKAVADKKSTEVTKAITATLSTSSLADEDKQLLKLIEDKTTALSTVDITSGSQEVIEQIMNEVKKAITFKEKLAKLNSSNSDSTLKETLSILNSELGDILSKEIAVLEKEVATQNVYVQSRQASSLAPVSKLALSSRSKDTPKSSGTSERREK